LMNDQSEGSLFDKLSALEKEMTGTPVKKLKGIKVETVFGTFDGGYIPVIYNPKLNERQAKNKEEKTKSSGRLPSTKTGSVNERIESYSAPILLDIYALPSHINEVTHDITHRRAVRDVGKLLADNRIKNALQESLGDQYKDQFHAWLAHVTDDRNMEQTQAKTYLNWLRTARLNMSIASMGFKATTIIQQPLGITQSMDVMREMGGSWAMTKLAKELANMTKNPREFRDTVFALSGEMRHRMNTLDRDIRDNMKRHMGKSGIYNQGVVMAFQGIAYGDMMVSLPTWMASYKWALKEGYTESQAIEWGDSRVRMSQGSGSAKDLAAIQRGHEATKLITMFYSYFSAYYQRVRDSGRKVEKVSDFGTLVMRHWWLTAIPAVLSELMTGRGPEEDEDELEWAVRKVVLYPLLGVPLLRDMAGSVESGYDYQFTPIGNVGKAGVQLAETSYDLLQVDAEFSDFAVDATKAAGYFIGLPSGQVLTTHKHIMETMEGDTDFNPWYLLIREQKN